MVGPRCPSLSWPTSDINCNYLHPDHEVDVAIINHADPLFLKKISERCRLLYGSPRRLAELKIYAFKRYQDHRRYLDLEREYVQRTLARLSAP